MACDAVTALPAASTVSKRSKPSYMMDESNRSPASFASCSVSSDSKSGEAARKTSSHPAWLTLVTLVESIMPLYDDALVPLVPVGDCDSDRLPVWPRADPERFRVDEHRESEERLRGLGGAARTWRQVPFG